MARSTKMFWAMPTAGVLLHASVLMAQFSSGVQGNVQDASGAAVPNATVTLENAATHTSQKATSDASGVYRFASLAPGAYSITATATGFSSSKTDFALNAAETRDVSVSLAVGDVSQTVMVTSQAPLIDASDTRNSYTIDSQAIATRRGRPAASSVPPSPASRPTRRTIRIIFPSASADPSGRARSFTDSFRFSPTTTADPTSRTSFTKTPPSPPSQQPAVPTHQRPLSSPSIRSATQRSRT
jgi:hypothetical protein